MRYFGHERPADCSRPGARRDDARDQGRAWTQLFGMVSFELFGHFVNVVDENAAFFDQAMRLVGTLVGLPGLGAGTSEERIVVRAVRPE